ncbi:TRAM domain-containing protein [Tistrella bauzanensis]
MDEDRDDEAEDREDETGSDDDDGGPAGLRAGNEIEVEITALGSHGDGIGEHDGRPVFVSHALPGDRVLAAVDAVERDRIRARWLELITPARCASSRHARISAPAVVARCSIWRCTPIGAGSAAWWSTFWPATALPIRRSRR